MLNNLYVVSLILKAFMGVLSAFLFLFFLVFGFFLCFEIVFLAKYLC